MSKMKPGYIFPGDCNENITNTQMHAYCRESVGTHLIYTNIEKVRFYVKTTINIVWKYLGTPDCKYMQRMLVDLIRIIAYGKSPKKTLFNLSWHA